MNGVATEEEEMNKPGSDTATAAGDADKFWLLDRRHGVVVREFFCGCLLSSAMALQPYNFTVHSLFGEISLSEMTDR